MNIKTGYTYTLANKYFLEHKDPKLCKNKGFDAWQQGGRPYYIALQDTKNPNIFWAVPLSSNVDKYYKIIEQKLARGKKCDTLHLGRFGNRSTTFLIQNMCPVDSRSIKDLCTTQQGNALMPDRLDARIVRASAAKLLKISRTKPIFNVDVKRIYKALARAQTLTKKVSIHPRANPDKPSTKDTLKNAKRRAQTRNTNKRQASNRNNNRNAR